MRKILLAATIFWLTVTIAWGGVDPQALVKTTAEDVLGILKERKSDIERQPAILFSLVEKKVLPHFDFVRISRWVLGKYWRKATDGERAQFTEAFKQLLVRTYAKSLLEYTDQELKYLPLRSKSGDTDVTVRTEIEQPGGFPIPIDYAMHLNDGNWLVYDVKIDGISLVANYRTTFASEIRRAGLPKLIARLVQRNLESRDG